MNTRKLFFGFLALAFLAMTAVSTGVVKDNLEDDGKTSIERSLKKL